MRKKASIVLTTINVPLLLDDYADNFEKFGHQEDVSFIVIPDRKTPPEAREVVDRIAHRGFDADYVDLPRQEDWLEKFPDLKAIIPYNSDNRRNIGYLMAVERGCDILISIDDDNYCSPEEDFYAGHSIVGSIQTRPVIESSSGWFNICDLLEKSPNQTIYPRGFPYHKRDKDVQIQERRATGYVAVNAGLWIHDPDVDAVTRLHEDVKTTRLNRDPILLAPQTKSPINSQNTALISDAIAAYYFVLMGETVHGSKIDRYGDIFSGYFLRKCVEHMGHYVGVGSPVATHKRNRHNLLEDLRQELWGMILTQSLVEMLDQIKLQGNTYAECYRDLSFKLEKASNETADKYFNDEVRAYFQKISSAMRVWLDVYQELAGAKLKASG